MRTAIQQPREAQSRQLGFVPVGSEHCAQHVGDIHPRQTNPLRRSTDGCKDDSCGKTPKKPATPVHGLFSLLERLTSPPVWIDCRVRRPEFLLLER